MTEDERARNREQSRRYRAAHPDYYRAVNQRDRAARRAERKAAVLTPEERAARERLRRAAFRAAHPRVPRVSTDPRETRRRYYEAHKDHPTERRIAWLAAHREDAARYAKEWREKNVERFRSARAHWREENWQKVLESNGRRRAAMRTTVVERIDRVAIYERDHGACYLCGERVAIDSFSLDHVIPLARGGHHVATNLRPTHLQCNLRKGVGPAHVAPVTAART